MSQATSGYRPMWEALGQELPGHDALLSAIPVMYQDAYLSQANRPEGMAYFDFVMSEIHGLRIDTDYSAGDIGQLSTRVEAFLEMIE